jgi:WXG100 family type VII secretion target
MIMAAGLQVTAETLSTDARRIAAGAGQIDAQLTSLKNAVTNVVNSGWIGSAANAAADLHAKLDQAGKDVAQSTTFFSESTSTAATDYENRENEIRHALTGPTP